MFRTSAWVAPFPQASPRTTIILVFVHGGRDWGLMLTLTTMRSSRSAIGKGKGVDDADLGSLVRNMNLRESELDDVFLGEEELADLAKSV